MASLTSDFTDKSNTNPNPKHPLLNPKVDQTSNMRTAVFFVNAAPYADMINELRKFYDENKDNMKIMFACSLEELMLPVKKPEDFNKKGIRGLPSNTRVFDGGIGFKLNSKKSLMIGPGAAALDLPFVDPPPRSELKYEIKNKTTDDMFVLAQEEVTNAIHEMLNFAMDNNIPLYFSMLERSDRPLYIQVNQDGRVVGLAPPPDRKTEKVAPHDIPLTNWILENIVIPAYGSEENLAKLLATMSKYKASMLADIYPLAMAFLDDEHWNGYTITHKTERSKYLKAGVLNGNIDNLPYASIVTTGNGNHVFSLKPESKPLVLEKLKNLMQMEQPLLSDSTKEGKDSFFDSAFVVHDTLLNDIDDAPAKHWIKSKSLKYDETCNYNRENFQLTRNLPNSTFKPLVDITPLALAKMRKMFKGDISQCGEKKEQIINPRVDPTVFISAYHKMFGITGGNVDQYGYAELEPENKGEGTHTPRQNAFDNEQTASCYDFDDEGYIVSQEFMICRNGAGRGGTPGAQDGEAGSLSEKFKGTVAASMSKWHEFVIPLDTSMYWCNAMFFGSGPSKSKYDIVGTLDMLKRLQTIGFEWAEARGINNPFFGFHEFPQNSLFHLHLHCIDMESILGEDGKILPSFEAHFGHTIPLKTYIDKLQQMLNSKTCAQ